MTRTNLIWPYRCATCRKYLRAGTTIDLTDDGRHALCLDCDSGGCLACKGPRGHFKTNPLACGAECDELLRARHERDKRRFNT